MAVFRAVLACGVRADEGAHLATDPVHRRGQRPHQRFELLAALPSCIGKHEPKAGRDLELGHDSLAGLRHRIGDCRVHEACLTLVLADDERKQLCCLANGTLVVGRQVANDERQELRVVDHIEQGRCFRLLIESRRHIRGVQVTYGGFDTLIPRLLFTALIPVMRCAFQYTCKPRLLPARAPDPSRSHAAHSLTGPGAHSCSTGAAWGSWRPNTPAPAPPCPSHRSPWRRGRAAAAGRWARVAGRVACAASRA